MPWLEDPMAAAMALPPLVVALLVFGSALLKYVFPPWSGDTVVLLGFFLAAQGAASPPLVFAAAAAGSGLGAAVAFALGRRYGTAILRFVLRRRRGRRRQTRRLLRLYGEPVLLVNRFLPVVRGTMLYGAGAAELRFWPAFFYTNLSNLAFLALLMGLGYLAAGSWQELLAAAGHYQQLLGLAAVAAAGVWIVAALARWRPPQSVGD